MLGLVISALDCINSGWKTTSVFIGNIERLQPTTSVFFMWDMWCSSNNIKIARIAFSCTKSRHQSRLEAGFHIPNLDGVALPSTSASSDSWNMPNQVPMADWLAQSQSAAEKARLHTLGNCVVPMMAQIALLKLSEILGVAAK